MPYVGQARIIIPRPDGSAFVFYEPSEKQDVFHLTCARNVLYGGAAGGGKSHAIRMDAYMRCLSVPGFRALILRRTFPELRNTHIDKAIIEAEQLGGKYNKSEFTARWPNGSTLEFGHCEDDAAVAKYLSTEYDCIYFDELVTFTRHQFTFISTRARSTKPGLLPMIRCGTNPGGENAHWVKQLFITKNPDPEEFPRYNPDDYIYIPATLDDNPHIDKAEYEARLMALPSEALRQAYRFGSWDTFEGQYFSEWRQHNDEGQPWHVIDELPTINGKPITEIPWIEYVRAIDWGYTDPGICGWYALMPDGSAIKVKEYVFRRKLAVDVAKEIEKQSRGMRIRYTVADPAMWTKDGSVGESIAESFSSRRHGTRVALQEADNERVNGWQRLHHWLTHTTGYPPRPLLQFYREGCPYTIRTIPAMVIDPNRPEDTKTKGVEDHAADETRYFVMSRPMPSRNTVRVKYKPMQAGYELQQFRKRRSGSQPMRLGSESVRSRKTVSW